MITNELISQIQMALQKESKILAAYIIGWTVSGKTTSGSDFDLAVVVDNKKVTDENKVYELIRHLRFPKDLDLSVVDRSFSPLFLFQIIAKGKRIYARNQPQTSKFEAYALHHYYDTAYIRNIYNQSLKEKFPSYANW